MAVPLPEPKWAWEREVGDAGQGPNQIAKTPPVAFRNWGLLTLSLELWFPRMINN